LLKLILQRERLTWIQHVYNIIEYHKLCAFYIRSEKIMCIVGKEKQQNMRAREKTLGKCCSACKKIHSMTKPPPRYG